MTPSTEPTKQTRPSLTHSFGMLAFGLSALGFCVAIDHPEWFHIRPATGTAVAMARASSSEVEASRADSAASRAETAPWR